jgi:hypothetical protein
MANVLDSEYDELRKFFSFYSSRYLPIDKLPPELRPMARLEVLEKRSRRMAREGLRQAINDVIEESRHLDPTVVRTMDVELAAQGLITLSELRRRFSREYARILRRKSISNETEYYLIRGVVDALVSEIPERELLYIMIKDYEAKIL